MASYTVTAHITFEITNPSALQAVAALSGSTGGDELAQVEAAVRSGLSELPRVGERYGFKISDSDANVVPAG